MQLGRASSVPALRTDCRPRPLYLVVLIHGFAVRARHHPTLCKTHTTAEIRQLTAEVGQCYMPTPQRELSDNGDYDIGFPRVQPSIRPTTQDVGN